MPNAYADLDQIYRIYHTTPTLQSFEICQGGGCPHADPLQLTEAEWVPVTRLFTPLPMTAAEERSQIALAIGLLEDTVGTKTGTAADRAGTFGNSEYLHQQDCNDEAINTTTFLRLLSQAGLLQFHAVMDMRTRHFFLRGWPHTAAVIREQTTQTEYAVDSWFYDNGHPATIVPLTQWKSGYVPEDSPLSR